jgi:hypothetical protein
MKTLAKTRHAGEIRRRMLDLAPSDQPLWGVMNANQMMCHLRWPYSDALSSMPVAVDKLPLPAPLIKLISLYLPRPWPKSLPTLAEYRVGSPALSSTEFDMNRAELLNALDTFCAEPNLVRAHPFFGKMSHSDWMRWGYLHADHHLRQFGH